LGTYLIKGLWWWLLNS